MNNLPPRVLSKMNGLFRILMVANGQTEPGCQPPASAFKLGVERTISSPFLTHNMAYGHS